MTDYRKIIRLWRNTSGLGEPVRQEIRTLFPLISSEEVESVLRLVRSAFEYGHDIGKDEG